MVIYDDLAIKSIFFYKKNSSQNVYTDYFGYHNYTESYSKSIPLSGNSTAMNGNYLLHLQI